MSTFRELVKASSGLGEGIMLRTHLLNLGSGGSGDIYVGVPLSSSIESGMKATFENGSLNASIEQSLSAKFITQEQRATVETELTANIECGG